jgi:hypothetical protein
MAIAIALWRCLDGVAHCSADVPFENPAILVFGFEMSGANMAAAS